MTKPATDELIAKIEVDLDGVTPGPWHEGVDGNQRVYGPSGMGDDSGLIAKFVRRRDLSHIARCSPDNIAALIARIRQQDTTLRIHDAEVDLLYARIAEKDAEIERLHRGDEQRVKDISRLIHERDEARDEIERLRAALAEYVCKCKGQCQAEIYGGSCGRLAYTELKGGEA